MRSPVRLVVIGLVATAACRAAAAEGNVNIILGPRAVNEDFWRPVDDHVAIGVVTDFGGRAAPVHLSIGLHRSEDEQIDFTTFFGLPFARVAARGELIELNVGVDKVWAKQSSVVRPYIGGGVAFVDAKIEDNESGLKGGDHSPGLYARAGILWATGGHSGGLLWNWGFDMRALIGTEIEFAGISGNADYVQLGLLLGMGW